MITIIVSDCHVMADAAVEWDQLSMLSERLG
jgi:hypothetical protein